MNATLVRIAPYFMTSVFLLSLIFHTLVLSGVIDYRIVWGGRMQTLDQMYSFEGISLGINGIFFLLMLIHHAWIRISISFRVMRGIFWGMFVLFILNTVGNLLSANSMEKIIFTPVTALLAFFSFILARSKNRFTA